MPGIKDVATEFAAFAAALSTERRELIDSMAVLNNGFEGWLKLEFYFWLIKNSKLQASLDVGMEYKVALDQRYGAMDRESKQCDLWIRDHLEAGYHYIELKAPFANTNQGKVMQSAADDFWYMSRLKESSERVVSGSAIILGVGFAPESWNQHIGNLVDYSEMPTESVSIISGFLDDHAHIRWAALTNWY